MQNSDDLLLNPTAIAKNRRRYFFKYMPFETAVAVLQNRTLRWSTAAVLNDPFDLQFNLLIDVDLGRVKKLALDQIWNDHFGEKPAKPGNELGDQILIARQNFARKNVIMSRERFGEFFDSAMDECLAKVLPSVETARAKIQPMLNQTKVLCLATQPDNMLMWSHYAQQHAGVVIRLENIPRVGSPYCMAEAISYPSGLPRWVNEQALADLLSGRGRTDPDELFRKIFLTKSDHWKYEAEWRVHGGFGEDRNVLYEDLNFAALELESLIFGYRIGDDKRIQLLDAARKINPAVRLWNAKPSKSEFRMEIFEFE